MVFILMVGQSSAEFFEPIVATFRNDAMDCRVHLAMDCKAAIELIDEYGFIPHLVIITDLIVSGTRADEAAWRIFAKALQAKSMPPVSIVLCDSPVRPGGDRLQRSGAKLIAKSDRSVIFRSHLIQVWEKESRKKVSKPSS